MRQRADIHLGRLLNWRAQRNKVIFDNKPKHHTKDVRDMVLAILNIPKNPKSKLKKTIPDIASDKSTK